MRKFALIPVVMLVIATALSLGGASKSSKNGQMQAGSAASSALPLGARSAMNSIDPARIRAHVQFLSSDLLEGRGTGQRGGDIAAEYIATQFALYGLKPAGDQGSYMQKVPMVGITTEPSSTVFVDPGSAKPMQVRLADDIVAMDESQNPTSEVDADVVFVGYGIAAPEYKWDDYKDADLRGKVLLMLVNEPPSDDPAFFNGKALTYYGRWTYKFEEAARRGAVGAMIIHKVEMASYGWDVVRNSWGGERSYLRGDEHPKVKLASWIQLEVARQLLSSANQNLDTLLEQAKSRDFKPIALPVKVKAHMVSKIRPFDSQNVLAILPGSDTSLKGQAILYSAHYDHLGVHPEQQGDNIYNGAIDNATGCAVLLELARAFASAPQPPKRSLLFASVTAEEQGLRGSEYLGKHPPTRAGDISLALNFDGIAPNGIPEHVEVSGSERTTFYPVVQASARDFGMEIKPDANPGAGFYYRSDHFSLARVGMPAFSVNEGMKFKGHPLEWGVEREKEYNAKNYHQPSDEFHPDWDFSGIAQVAKFGFDLGWKAASQPQIIGWRAGDEFEAVRKASQAKMMPSSDAQNQAK